MNPSKDELSLVQETAGLFKRKNGLLQKLDWVFIIRFIMGLPFLYMAYAFDDWFPAMFGAAIIATGIIAAFTKTGCGYTGGCAHHPQVETND